jgi:hypothetical protein
MAPLTKRHRNGRGQVTDMSALLRLVRDGGVAPHLRPAVWPLLLGLVGPDDCGTARAAKWGVARGEFERLTALAGDEAAAAAYYEREVGSRAQPVWAVSYEP